MKLNEVVLATITESRSPLTATEIIDRIADFEARPIQSAIAHLAKSGAINRARPLDPNDVVARYQAAREVLTPKSAATPNPPASAPASGCPAVGAKPIPASVPNPPMPSALAVDAGAKLVRRRETPTALPPIAPTATADPVVDQPLNDFRALLARLPWFCPDWSSEDKKLWYDAYQEIVRKFPMVSAL